MTIIRKSLMAAAVTLAVQAHAAQYNVTGNLTATKVVGALASSTLTLTPTQPAFGAIWDIDTAGNTIAGGLDFESYTVGIKALIFTATVSQSNAVYQFSGGAGNASYNAATNTMTIGQVLNYGAATGTSTSSLLWNTAADPAHGLSAGTAGTCTGAGTICDNQRDVFLANPNLERFYLSLTFDGLTNPNGDGVNIFSSFTGTAVSVDVGNGTTGNSWTQYSFSGVQEVPLPAAAWLMGSGLLGLAGVARRRRAKD